MDPKTPLTIPLLTPLLIYDGDCGFCKKWIALWQKLTQGKVEYRPSQEVSAHFPQIPADQYEKSVVLVMPSGTYYKGAEAVFRSLAESPSLTAAQLAVKLYKNVSLFRSISERSYTFVAEHRVLFSRITRLLLGEDLKPPSFQFSRWIFLRVMGLIYLVAFASLGSQLPGLVGTQGILPSVLSDTELQALWMGGVTLSVLLLLGLVPVLCLMGLWIGYFILVQSCGEFFWFQWDALMLEMGFLAIFLAPWTLRSMPLRRVFQESTPSFSNLFLLRWLLFRVVFFSGWVKLASGDPNWRNLTALSYHFETQPLPTWVSWYIHQLPSWVLQTTTVFLFIAELGLPLLIFLPKRAKTLGALSMVALQLLIDFSGNYGFFGWQVTALCLLILDDDFWTKWTPRILLKIPDAPHAGHPEPEFKRWLSYGLLTSVLLVTLLNFRFLAERLGPYQIINHYGVFAVMTTQRDEIIIEGSQDGKTWLPYEFKWKPGDLKRMPGFVEPHMPRLDWQMWFASLGSFENSPWTSQLMAHLLRANPAVLSLLKTDPFSGSPPRYIRALRYNYNFTNSVEKATSGNWWKRELKGEFSPTFSVR